MTTARKLLAAAAALGISLGALTGTTSASAAPNVHPWLLSLSQMPTGWKVDPDNGSNNSPSINCNGNGNGNGNGKITQAASQAVATYEEPGGFGPFYVEALGSWPAPSEAHRAWVLATRCMSSHLGRSNSDGTIWTTEPANLGRYGNATAAWDISASAEGIPADMPIVFAQKRRVLVVLAYVDFGGGSNGLSLFRSAINKIKG